MTTVLVYHPQDVFQPYAEERDLVERHGGRLVFHNGDPAQLREADMVICVSGTKSVMSAELQQMERCGLIVHYGIGFNMIDVDAATELGIVVANCPTYCIREVSDHTLGLILALTRCIPWFDRGMRAGEWASLHPVRSQVRRLDTQTLGIIGLGKIGRLVAQKAAPFGFRILGYDPYLPADAIQALGATPATFEELLRTADIVTLHVPLMKGTHHLIDAQALALMKPTALLINTSRGKVVDEAALIRALDAGQIRGAGLDTLYEEPPDPNNPLFRMDPLRVIVTPHFAAGSADALVELKRQVVAALDAYINGYFPAGTVNPAVQPRKPLRPSRPA